jgi:hypothetical protein
MVPLGFTVPHVLRPSQRRRISTSADAQTDVPEPRVRRWATAGPLGQHDALTDLALASR